MYGWNMSSPLFSSPVAECFRCKKVSCINTILWLIFFLFKYCFIQEYFIYLSPWTMAQSTFFIVDKMVLYIDKPVLSMIKKWAEEFSWNNFLQLFCFYSFFRGFFLIFIEEKKCIERPVFSICRTTHLLIKC